MMNPLILHSNGGLIPEHKKMIEFFAIVTKIDHENYIICKLAW